MGACAHIRAQATQGSPVGALKGRHWVHSRDLYWVGLGRKVPTPEKNGGAPYPAKLGPPSSGFPDDLAA